MKIGKPHLEREKNGVDHSIALKSRATKPAERNQRIHSIPYSIVVHSYSALTLDAHVEQSDHEPGAVITISAWLARAGIPMPGNARQNPPRVWVEVVRPKDRMTLALSANAEGHFEGRFTAIMPGVYRFRIRASGVTAAGEPFTREKTLSAAVWRQHRRIRSRRRAK